LIIGIFNYQVHLNHRVIDSAGLNETAIKKWITDSLKSVEGVARVIDIEELGTIPLNATIKNMIANGYFPRRSGNLQIVLQPHWLEGGATGTTHGSWNPYDAHIPLLWYGWNITPGKTHRETYMTDIAPTLAAILKIQMPSGVVGKVIEEVVR
jgi:hypothetical protein